MKLKISGQFWRHLLLERLHRILVLVIVLQLIQCFTDYWWEETYSIIYGALAVTAVTELLFTRLLRIRVAIQCVTVIGLIVWKTPMEWRGWPDSWRTWDDVSSFFSFHSGQLHPFFELTIGVIALVHVLAWVGSRRAGAIIVVVLSIAVMASVDSFFPLELWHNIAWIVTAGLAWLVILHLRQLQVRHPDSWEALAERPIDIAFPAIIIITILLLTGIFMPRAPVLLEDPYTIWTEAQGREVPVFAGEGGVQKTSSSGSKGSSLSGYSRDDRKIGGGFQFDYSPVMTITTSQKSYWRGETKSVYTGKGWGDIKSPQLIPNAYGNKADLELSAPRAEGVKTVEVIQTVTVSRKDRMSVLFGAGPVSSVSELKSNNNAGLSWNPEEWELRWSKPASVESYSVVSQVAVLDENALREVTAPPDGSIDLAKYLQLPDTLPERVHDLALEQTSGLTNDYDRAKKLEQFLKDSFPYTNTPDLTRRTDRANGDIVDAFLFEIQEGYCDYFSTSFVVMARSIGLPTRWVKGYSTGFDPSTLDRARFGGPGEVPDPSGAGTYTVRNADAHSWAEVYFEGYGWIPFEPTSGFSVPQPIPEGEVLQPDVDTPVDAAPSDVDAGEKNKDWLVPAGATGVVLIILSLVFIGYRSRRAQQLWNHIRNRGNTPNQRVVREMERLLSFLQRQGLRREAHETIRETFNRWGNKFSSLRGEFDGALTSFEQARYGHDNGSSQLLNDFNDAATKIRKAL
ncbi:transglutaminaseTgpA domain-containing protein [Cohnella luojiensis]|nr:transglutaminaseTgpA domain-containing protein [Cohnella luojiensis]